MNHDPDGARLEPQVTLAASRFLERQAPAIHGTAARDSLTSSGGPTCDPDPPRKRRSRPSVPDKQTSACQRLCAKSVGATAEPFTHAVTLVDNRSLDRPSIVVSPQTFVVLVHCCPATHYYCDSPLQKAPSVAA